MGEKIREVVRERRFEDELRQLIHEALAADEFVEAAEYLLARDPLIGSPIAENQLVYFLPMAPVDDRQISLYYTFDASTVWLLSIASV
ncbi:MAG: hypothetical protein ABR611_12955 [Chthoniobacterales bacterium]